MFHEKNIAWCELTEVAEAVNEETTGVAAEAVYAIAENAKNPTTNIENVNERIIVLSC